MKMKNEQNEKKISWGRREEFKLEDKATYWAKLMACRSTGIIAETLCLGGGNPFDNWESNCSESGQLMPISIFQDPLK